MLHIKNLSVELFVLLALGFMMNDVFSIIISSQCVLDSIGCCVFKNIFTSELEPSFNPNQSKVTAVTKVQFENSKIPIFTNELCETFPNLENIEAVELSLIRINIGALDRCRMLTSLNFSTNKLTGIPEYFFRYNLDLTFVSFQQNIFKKFDFKLVSHLRELNWIILDENWLTSSTFTELPYLEKLTTISISKNEIEDLNETEIKRKFPKLNTFYIEDNPFNCDRLLEILKVFQKKNVAVKQHSKYKRERNYTSTIIDGVDCLPDDEKARLFPTLFKNNSIAKESVLNEENYPPPAGCNATSSIRFAEVILICSGILLIILVAINIWLKMRTPEEMYQKISNNPATRKRMSLPKEY